MKLTRLVTLLSAIAFLFVAQPALAADPVTNAVNGLRSSHVYVDPGATVTMSGSDAQSLASQIGNGPVYIAVIPDVGSGYDSLPKQIGQGLGARGVYAVVSGKHFRAGSNILPKGEAEALATQSFQNESPRVTGSIVPMLSDFVNRVRSAMTSTPGGGGRTTVTTTTTTSFRPHKSHALATFLWVLACLAILGLFLWAGVALVQHARNKAEQERIRLEDERRQAEEDRRFKQAKLKAENRMTSLAGDVVNLSDSAKLHPKAKSLYGQAVDLHTQAGVALESAQTVSDVNDALTLVSQAEGHMSNVKAYLDGRDPIAEARAAEKERLKAEAAAERARVKEEARLAKEREARAAERREQQARAATVTPQNYTPSRTCTSSCGNYFGGGYYGGFYYGPGYYADPFWTWVVMDQLFDHSQYDYDNGNYGNYDQTTTTTTTYDSNGGDWGSSSSNGGDWDSSSSSSSSGGDWGSSSGYDYSSSGGDWGGGSFDSGSSSSGGGDW